MMTALALLAPLVGLGLVLALQLVESHLLRGPHAATQLSRPIPTPFRRGVS